MKRKAILLALISLTFLSLTISEKRQSLSASGSSSKSSNGQTLAQINQALKEKHEELLNLYIASQQDYNNAVSQGTSEELIEALFKGYLGQILELKKEITALEANWKALSQASEETEQEGLWHQPDTSIGHN